MLTIQHSGPDGEITTTFEYDGIQRLVRVTDTEGNVTASIVEIDLCKLSLFRQFRLSMSVAGRREPLPGFNDVPKLRLFFYLHTPVLTALFQRGSGRLRCRGTRCA